MTPPQNPALVTLSLIKFSVSADVFEMSVQFAGGTATAGPLNLLSGLSPSVTSTGDYDQPGALEVSWTGADSGHVATWIPINHHANPYTWTQCMVEADAGGFTVPEDMVNPLAVRSAYMSAMDLVF